MWYEAKVTNPLGLLIASDDVTTGEPIVKINCLLLSTNFYFKLQMCYSMGHKKEFIYYFFLNGTIHFG